MGLLIFSKASYLSLSNFFQIYQIKLLVTMRLYLGHMNTTAACFCRNTCSEEYILVHMCVNPDAPLLPSPSGWWELGQVEVQWLIICPLREKLWDWLKSALRVPLSQISSRKMLVCMSTENISHVWIVLKSKLQLKIWLQQCSTKLFNVIDSGLFTRKYALMKSIYQSSKGLKSY